MPDENERLCLWCSKRFTYTYPNRMLCSQKCHCDFHRFRVKDYSGLSPLEFKNLIVEMLKQHQHPNKNHPINTTNEDAIGTIENYEKTIKEKLKNE